MTVWIIQSGEYEQRGVDGVASSPEDAMEWLKARNVKDAASHPSNRLCIRWEMTDTSFGENKQHRQVTITGYHTEDKYFCDPDIYELEPYEVVGTERDIPIPERRPNSNPGEYVPYNIAVEDRRRSGLHSYAAEKPCSLDTISKGEKRK